MSKIIYLVVAGDYSDYSVHAAYENRELAVQHRDALIEHNYVAQVEEYEILEYVPLKVTQAPWHVVLEMATGEVLWYRRTEDSMDSFEGWVSRYSEGPQGRVYDKQVCAFHTFVDGRHAPERAIKVANERRLIYKTEAHFRKWAQDRGLDPDQFEKEN